MGNSHKHRHIPKAANSLQDECIRVPKVYDWVTDTLTVTKNLMFTREQLEEIECALEDPSRRPLRIVCQTPKTPPLFPLTNSDPKLCEEKGFYCEQVGEKRNVTVPINGEFVEAQLVDLIFTTDVCLEVIDRHGNIVTKIHTDVCALESFVLCYPDGTDLLCRVSKIFCRMSCGSLLLNCPAPSSIKVEVTFCVDVQVEAEVKLEVLAKFCSPRNNDIEAEEVEMNKCPPVEFPKQCPDIFPRPNCECSACGEASGRTGRDCTEEGEAGIFVDICPNCSLVDSSFEFTFEDKDTSDGLKNLNFHATSFDQDSLECRECEGGLKLIVSGEGRTSRGHHLDFNLALVDSSFGDQFQVQLIDERTGEIVFDTGIVDVAEGDLEVEDCVTFKDLKFKKPV
ncbi:hypothetical protein JOD45_000242 [Scopulibacillus daqui]|uniref:Uncharacterized protein n=1 Tax=Scopulibacillus daqui TaxID=1469162 RepID=A0ABS2PVU4_9BACL|nr:hypothetical protein [Scopulibacillus daqui]MBM7644051.1 hypothetical protein [Scopulibacillus daqui]